MMKIRLSLIVVAALAVAAAGPAGSDSDATSYRLRMPLTLAGDAPVQRITVPAQALVASQSADLSDIRVFDASGRPVPMARIAAVPAPSREIGFPALPILGSRPMLDVTGVSLAIDDQGRARVASLDGKITKTDATTMVVGALFDTRAQNGQAEQLALDASVPASQPVTFTVEGSADLKTWQPLGERVVYRTPSGAGRNGDAAIALRGSLQPGTWLRVTWRAETPLIAPVVVRGATLTTRAAVVAPLVIVPATTSVLADGHTLEFDVPFATPIATITVDPRGNEGILPVRILGRNSREAPWMTMGEGRAAATTATAIAIGAQAVRMIRIEADRRTSGFTVAPAIRFGLSSHEIAFVASGRPPYEFAAGRALASNIFLPLDRITRVAASAIPRASIADAPAAPIALLPVADGGASQRRLILWAILIAVTALLAGIAWHLWRRTKPQLVETPKPNGSGRDSATPPID